MLFQTARSSWVWGLIEQKGGLDSFHTQVWERKEQQRASTTFFSKSWVICTTSAPERLYMENHSWVFNSLQQTWACRNTGNLQPGQLWVMFWRGHSPLTVKLWNHLPETNQLMSGLISMANMCFFYHIATDVVICKTYLISFRALLSSSPP